MTGLDISKNNEILILERWGKITLLNLENLDFKFYAQIPNVKNATLKSIPPFHHETGAFDLLIDKDSVDKEIIFVTYTTGKQSLFFNVDKLEMNESSEPEMTTLFQTTGNRSHNGGKLMMGNDKKLYISVGEQIENVRDPNKS